MTQKSLPRCTSVQPGIIFSSVPNARLPDDAGHTSYRNGAMHHDGSCPLIRTAQLCNARGGLVKTDRSTDRPQSPVCCERKQKRRSILEHVGSGCRRCNSSQYKRPQVQGNWEQETNRLPAACLQRYVTVLSPSLLHSACLTSLSQVSCFVC